MVEMILIIRTTKVFRDKSCQTTPCKRYCPWKGNNDGFYVQFPVVILKTMIDRKKLSNSEMTIMISPTKVVLSQIVKRLLVKFKDFVTQKSTRGVIQAAESLLFKFTFYYCCIVKDVKELSIFCEFDIALLLMYVYQKIFEMSEISGSNIIHHSCNDNYDHIIFVHIYII